MIEDALSKARDYPQKNTEDDEKTLRSYFEALRQRSDKVLKK